LLLNIDSIVVLTENRQRHLSTGRVTERENNSSGQQQSDACYWRKIHQIIYL